MSTSRPALRGLLAAAAVLALSLTACSTGPTDATAQATSAAPTTAASAPAADTFPVTIKHAFGEATIPAQPTRVATVSWVNADIALALDVVPVGMSKEDWGANEHGSTPWKDAALTELGAPLGTDKGPTLYSELDGLPFNDIAAVDPDVILAAYSGITAEDYETLSKIAPVVAYPEIANGTPWQESTRMIGRALGKSAAAEKLVADTEALIAQAAAAHPELQGKTFIYGSLNPGENGVLYLYTANDNTSRFLTSLGMTLAPVVTKAAEGSTSYYAEWSKERANELASDVYVAWLADPKAGDQVKTDPLLSQIPAVKNGGLVIDSDATRGLALLATNPLNIPYLLEGFVPMLAEAANAAGTSK